MSVERPTPRSNSSVSSKAGVAIGSYPARAQTSAAIASTRRRARASDGRTSKVPRGTWNLLATVARPYLRELASVGQFGEEWIRGLLDTECGDSHVAGVDARLGTV